MLPPTDPIITDALVIGAGPVGLFQVFQLGLQGIHAEVVDVLPQAGGQCVALYPDKPIYDIPGLPVCTGRELADRLLQQVAPFRPGWHWGHEIASVHRCDDGRFEVASRQGTRWKAQAIFIAAGVGAFVPRALRIPGLEAFEGSQLHYHHTPPVAQLAGRRVVVVGADEAAVQSAVQVARVQDPVQGPRSVTLVHRKDQFEASAPWLAELQQLRSQGAIRVALGQPVGIQTRPMAGTDRLTALQLATDDDEELSLQTDVLLVHLGLSPRLGPLADWGLLLERKLLPVDPATLATSVPGVYAVGDINHYPGKRKLIVCGFHEATLAAFAAAAQLNPGQPVHLQYTTTSTQLHQRLGVAQR